MRMLKSKTSATTKALEFSMTAFFCCCYGFIFPWRHFLIFLLACELFLPGESATPDAQGKVAGRFDSRRMNFCFFLQFFFTPACAEAETWPAMSVSEPGAAGHCFCALGRGKECWLLYKISVLKIKSEFICRCWNKFSMTAFFCCYKYCTLALFLHDSFFCCCNELFFLDGVFRSNFGVCEWVLVRCGNV